MALLAEGNVEEGLMASGMISLTYPVGEKSIGGFAIDAYIVEAYHYENSITNLTVEDGSNISDHVIEKPDRLNIEAFIGATKFETFTGERIRELSDIEMPNGLHDNPAETLYI